MIIIDELADTRLIKALETTRRELQPHLSRCIHFHFDQEIITPSDESLRKQIVAITDQHLHDGHPEIYFCEDGDVYILTASVPSALARRTILGVAEQLDRPADGAWVNFYELDRGVNQLLVNLEQKLAKKRAFENELRRQEQRRQTEQRRQNILSDTQLLVTGTVDERRRQRDTMQLMIIEDDIFSRRLVENVLQKEYPLSALGNAERALSTYAMLAPDLLFLDINLPDVSGLELLEKIIALDPHAYIVMISGNCDEANIRHAMKAGAKGFVAKPFTREKLLQYIQRCPRKQH